MRFDVVDLQPVRLDAPEALTSQQLMSPYVWRSSGEGALSMVVRAVPPPGSPDPVTGRIWLAHDTGDGLNFTADPAPLIVPGPDAIDRDGCEDPTVVPTDGDCVVYYTGLDAGGSGQMLYASGPDLRGLEKRGVALASSKTERNTKEATVERTDDGRWRLFYEYAFENRSRIGLAFGAGPAGPWEERHDPFVARPDHWDNWHLSTGPLLMTDPQEPVMFYNGSDASAEWGVGWIAFSADLSRVTARCEAPLIAHPTVADTRDIIFAASCLQVGDDIWLYVSRNDQTLHRAVIRRT